MEFRIFLGLTVTRELLFICCTMGNFKTKVKRKSNIPLGLVCSDDNIEELREFIAHSGVDVKHQPGQKMGELYS